MILFSQTLSSPIGDLFALADENSLLFLDFADSREQNKKLQSQYQRYSLHQKNDILIETEKELSEYFAGTRKIFSIPIEFHGSNFQEKSWKWLQDIPYGETRSYQEQANQIWSPTAVRAIGWANHNNPIIIIIPCHRVIGKRGKLIGYSGWLDRKIWLLEHEKKYK